MTSDLHDSTTDLLVTPDRPDTESRLRLSTERATFLAKVSRTVGGSMQTDRAVDLILEMLVPEVVDWAQVVLREAGLLHCHATLAGGPVQHATVPAPREGTSTLSRVMSRGLRELSLIAMGPGATDTGALASAVPVPEHPSVMSWGWMSAMLSIGSWRLSRTAQVRPSRSPRVTRRMMAAIIAGE